MLTQSFVASEAAPSISVDANQIRSRAPLFEQYIRNVEDQTFSNEQTARLISYADFSQGVKRFGYGGLTHLNERHLTTSIAQLFGPSKESDQIVLAKKFYFSTTDDNKINTKGIKSQDFAIDQLLKVAMLLCSHASYESQIEELWFLVNRQLDNTVPKAAIIDLVRSFSEIAITRAKLVLEASQPQQSYERSQMQKSIEFLRQADQNVAGFLYVFEQSLPEQLDFAMFKTVVSEHCMNTSQLRMKVTQTDQSKMGQSLVISQVSTIVIEYLPPREQILIAQRICKKWYNRFAPLVIKRVPLSFRPWPGRKFRLRFETSSGDPVYLGLVSSKDNDVREKCGRTNYVSAGSGPEFRQFKWTLDDKGALRAADDSGACLAAHRTYICDCLGSKATRMISTVYPGHENEWRLERYGSLEQQRYLVALGNSKCVKDNVNMQGWLASARFPLPRSFGNVPGALDLQRDQASRFVYVCDSKLVQISEMPVWQLELDEQ